MRRAAWPSEASYYSYDLDGSPEPTWRRWAEAAPSRPQPRATARARSHAERSLELIQDEPGSSLSRRTAPLRRALGAPAAYRGARGREEMGA